MSFVFIRGITGVKHGSSQMSTSVGLGGGAAEQRGGLWKWLLWAAWGRGKGLGAASSLQPCCFLFESLLACLFI